MSIRKLILNQAGLPGITKDELKTSVICHVTGENAAVCMTKVGHVNTLSIKKIKEKKKKLTKPKRVTAEVSVSMFREFSKLQISWHIMTSSRTNEST